MKILEEKIISEGKIYPGNVLKVDSFVNHLIDVDLMLKLADEFYSLYKDSGITKILTIEASGIGISCLTAQKFNVPVLFAKKTKSKNMSNDVYSVEIPSYTHGDVNRVIVSREYLTENDTVLIIDDFLAVGSALKGLISLCDQAGAKVAGCGILIEKVYQGGGDIIRKRCRVESLAKISSMSHEGGIKFC